jgi:hypothetical protein
MEGYCSTGQSPQRAVVPMEEDYYTAVFCTLHFYKVVLPQKCMYVSAIFLQILRKLFH